MLTTCHIGRFNALKIRVADPGKSIRIRPSQKKPGSGFDHREKNQAGSDRQEKTVSGSAYIFLQLDTYSIFCRKPDLPKTPGFGLTLLKTFSKMKYRN